MMEVRGVVVVVMEVPDFAGVLLVMVIVGKLLVLGVLLLVLTVVGFLYVVLVGADVCPVLSAVESVLLEVSVVAGDLAE